jgi:hypothetical protein
MNLEAAKLMVESIGTLSSLVKVWQNARGSGADVTREQVEKTIESLQPSPSHATLEQITLIISQPVLDTIAETIADAIERLRDALSDPSNTQQDKDKEERVARATICRELKRVKRLNNNVLPDGMLEDYWRSFSCSY